MDENINEIKIDQEDVKETKEVKFESVNDDVKCEKCEKIEKEGNPLAVFVLGLLSILSAALGSTLLPLIGFILGLIAVIKGNKPRKLEEKPGIITAGWIMGIIGMIICGTSIVFTAVQIITYVPYHYYFRYFRF